MPMPFLRAVNGRSHAPLPDPWPALAQSRFGVRFLPSQFMMLCGPSGCGKSFLALDAALRMGCSCLYLSCDSDESTMLVRAAAAVSMHRQSDVRQALQRGAFEDLYGEALRRARIRLEFDPSNPTLDDIGHILEAYWEAEAAYPEFLVLDNLLNLEGDGGNEWSYLRQASKDLHWIARRTKACVLGLHHTSEDKDMLALAAPPKSAIKGKISEMAPVILTVGPGQGGLWMAAVKHRHGPDDPKALAPLWFDVDFERAQVGISGGVQGEDTAGSGKGGQAFETPALV